MNSEERRRRLRERVRADQVRRVNSGFVEELLKRLDDWTWGASAAWEPQHKQDVLDLIELYSELRAGGASVPRTA
jgi:hypothetical protein